MRLLFSRLIVAAVGCIALQNAAVIAQAGPPTVIVEDWLDAKGNGVTFHHSAPDVMTLDDAKVLAEQLDDTHTRKFQFHVDATALTWNRGCTCYRHYVVTIRSRQTGIVTRTKVRFKPSGSFDDQMVEVKLTVSETTGDRENTDSEKIALPVTTAPGNEPAMLTGVLREEVAPVTLAGPSEIQIVLRNQNKQTAVQLPADIAFTTDDTKLWKQPPAVISHKFPMTFLPNATQTIRVQVEPNTWEAIQASLAPTAEHSPHTRLRLRLSYANPTFQGRESSVDVDVPIRFRPSLVALFLWLVAGVTLGSLLRWLQNRSDGLRHWTLGTLTALVAALVFECLGIFLIANKSKFVVFNYDIDPWQTLSVLLLGIGNGLLGMAAARRLKLVDGDTP